MQNIITVKNKTFQLYLTEEEIMWKIKELAARLNNDFKHQRPLFIAVLNGSVMLASDLLKEITVECDITFVKLSSYNGMTSSGEIKTVMGLHENITGRTVIVLEDVVDTGLTVSELLKQLHENNPKTVKVLAFLHKKGVQKIEVALDYVGFEVPDIFLLGYGLDIDGQGRNLRNIYRLRK